MTAAMHRDFMELAITNALTEPGGARMLGTDLDLGKVDTDAYVVAGVADHLCSWESCYQTTQLLGGRTTFVLSTSGHIASMVNPPSNPKASYQTAPDNPPEAADWLASATKVRGTWWDDYATWLGERTGPLRSRPRRLGSVSYEPLCDAPGSYVLDR
jgi:poly(3-hydroxyalkanoate) synthetase